MRNAAILAGLAVLGLFGVLLWLVLAEEDPPTGSNSLAHPAPAVEPPSPPIVAPPVAAPAPPGDTRRVPKEVLAPEPLDLEAAESRQVVPHYGGGHRERQEYQDRGVECVRFFHDSRYEDSLKCFEDLLAQNPSKTRLHSQLGAVLAKLGRREEATKHYNLFVLLHPNDPRAPAVRTILENFWSSADVPWEGQSAAEPRDQAFGGRVEEQPPAPKEQSEAIMWCQRLYEEAYVFKRTQPEEAIRRLKEAQALCASEDTPYNDKIRHLLGLLEGGTADPSDDSSGF